jgi:hypothetical protein
MKRLAVPTRPLIIGWKEYLDFPEWGIRRLRAKVDTGARTSAIHVVEYELYENPEGGRMVRMRLSPRREEPGRHIIVHTPVLRTTVVTNSGGQKETRPVIETLIRLGPVTKRVQLTATNRESMMFRMLLGRKALEGDFLVDVAQAYLMRTKRRSSCG